MLGIIKIIEIIVSILLILVVLIQPKKSSLNLTTFWNDAVWKFERRWAEKTLHTLTIILWALFVLTSLAYFFFA